jgi:hypothetical protein
MVDQLQPPPGFVAGPAPSDPGQLQPPPGFVPGPLDQGAAQPWQGSILPFSSDASGKISFDPHAGIIGKAIDAFTLPGDVYSGRQQTPYGTGSSADPTLMERAANFATMTTPTSAATRAGALVPGTFASAVEAPTTAQLKATAEAGYAAARAADMTIPASTVSATAQTLQQTLQNNFGAIPKTAPKTFALLDELATPPKGVNAQANYTGLEAARRGLQGIAGEGGSDGFAAQQAIPHLDTFIDTISPDAATARANYAAAQRSNAITGDLTQANTGMQEQAVARAAASHSGMNLDNALRQRVASFLQNPDNVRGFSKEEVSSLNDFVQGNALSNALRKVSNLMGGGGGLGAVISAGGGALLGSHFGSPELGAMAAPMLGGALKAWENSRAAGALDAIAQQVRARSPLGQQYIAQGARSPNMLQNRAVVPLLSSPPTSPQAPGQLPSLPSTGPIPQGLLGGWA